MGAVARMVVIGGVALGLALAPVAIGGFTVTLLNYIGIYTLVALGLVLLTGCGGITSFGQAAFVGIGAYATAYLTARLALSPWLGFLASIALTSLIALIIGYVTLHLGGHYLPLTTIAWGMAIFAALGSFEFLGSHGGIGDIPPVSLAGLALDGMGRLYYLIWTLCGLSRLAASNLLASRQGRAIRALRGGRDMSASLGIDVFYADEWVDTGGVDHGVDATKNLHDPLDHFDYRGRVGHVAYDREARCARFVNRSLQ